MPRPGMSSRRSTLLMKKKPSQQRRGDQWPVECPTFLGLQTKILAIVILFERPSHHGQPFSSPNEQLSGMPWMEKVSTASIFPHTALIFPHRKCILEGEKRNAEFAKIPIHYPLVRFRKHFEIHHPIQCHGLLHGLRIYNHIIKKQILRHNQGNSLEPDNCISEKQAVSES